MSGSHPRVSAGSRALPLGLNAALRSRGSGVAVAPQLDRLTSVVGLDTVQFGIVPFSASLKIYPGNAFGIHDDRRVVVEDWHAELWLDDTDSVTTYQRVWDTIGESAL
jgi:hypothetical protein